MALDWRSFVFGKMTVLPLLAITFWVGGADAVDIEMVRVGNPRNAPDSVTMRIDGTTGYGSVDYEYSIATCEVTSAQYVEFLNAVATTDRYGLYNDLMWSSAGGCKIQRTGSPGDYSYSVTLERANRPVSHVSWGDAARFVNWIANGQPTGAQDLATTEDGAYFLDGATTQAQLMSVTRKNDAEWFIPTEDEWYKAAYHKNDGVTGNYWDYPTGTDTEPDNELIDPDPGNNANFYQDGHTIGAPYYTTLVGEFENSVSPYGTFDQGGNVVEWNETAVTESLRGLRGGTYHYFSVDLLSASRLWANPMSEYYDVGFRVAGVLKPTPQLLGDLNNDSAVDSGDLDIVRNNWGSGVAAGCLTCGDASGDGTVDSADLDIVRGNWGAGIAAVPEPGEVLLVILGAVLLAGLRRRVNSSL